MRMSVDEDNMNSWLSDGLESPIELCFLSGSNHVEVVLG